MALPRLQLFELEDQPWFPARIRDLGTDYLRFMSRTFELHLDMIEPLAAALTDAETEEIIDLCSGGAGPIPELVEELATRGVAVRATLTDRFPNLPAFEATAARSGDAIAYVAEPVDARDVPAELRGLRTLFNAMHHFRPSDARAVLRDAVEDGQPIGVFDIADRSLPVTVFLLVTPLSVMIATPFIRPFRWERLLWTYLIPIVPLYCLWDGIVSQFRGYHPEELLDLAEGLDDSYEWHARRIPMRRPPGTLTTLIGVRAPTK